MLGNLGPTYLTLNHQRGPKSPTLHYTARTRIRLNYVIYPCCCRYKFHASSCPCSHRTFERTQGQRSRRSHVPCQPPAQTTSLTGRLACRWKRAQVLLLSKRPRWNMQTISWDIPPFSGSLRKKASFNRYLHGTS